MTIVSILRLQVLIQFGSTHNLTCKLRNNVIFNFNSVTNPRGLYRGRILVNDRDSCWYHLRMCKAPLSRSFESLRILIFAQMPAMRSLFMNCMPRVMGQTTKDKSYGATSSGFSHGLSSGNNMPKGSQLSNRPKGDDDGDFIPLVDVESQAGTSIAGGHSLPPTRAGYPET